MNSLSLHDELNFESNEGLLYSSRTLEDVLNDGDEFEFEENVGELLRQELRETQK
jgi:hypothetical protein